MPALGHDNDPGIDGDVDSTVARHASRSSSEKPICTKRKSAVRFQAGRRRSPLAAPKRIGLAPATARPSPVRRVLRSAWSAR